MCSSDLEEKGVRTLLRAWSEMPPSARLVIVGDGPLRGEVAAVTLRLPGIEWRGQQPPHEVQALMREASVLVVPSEWPEPFGLVVVEAFAAGLPVIANRVGGIPEIVRDGATGWLVSPGHERELAARLRWTFLHPEERQAAGHAARREFEVRFTKDANYQELLSIYQWAMDVRARDVVSQ